VSTPDDLGTMAETPSHPELIDYLASRFMDEGWSIKKIHKLIMMSSVYQQGSGEQSPLRADRSQQPTALADERPSPRI